MTLEDARRLTEAQVLVLARYAWEASPQVFGRLAQMLQSEDPTLLRTLTGALFFLALGMQSHERRECCPRRLTPAQLAASRIHCSTDSGAGMRPDETSLPLTESPGVLSTPAATMPGVSVTLSTSPCTPGVRQRLRRDLLELAAVGAAGAVHLDGEHGQVPLGSA